MLCTAAKWTLASALSIIFCCSTSAFAASANAEAEPVARLYKDFGWQAFASQSELFGDGIAHQGKAVLARYFSPDLAKLLIRDAACQAKERGICRLDFDILFDTQDPVVTDLSVNTLALGKVQIQFKDPTSDEITTIAFLVEKNAGQWRIADILYGSKGERSLKGILQRR